jgi:DNA-binding FadR family transcriptional regulator
MSSSGRRLNGAVAKSLGQAILSGGYASGSVLLTEMAAAETMGVSRGAYREAIQVLIAKGLVESRTRTGTRVMPRHKWNMLDPDVLEWAFADTPDMHLLRSLFELRSAIEPYAAQLAAKRRDGHDLEVMRRSLETMARETLATKAGQTADREFHAAIIFATRNDALNALCSGITAGVEWTTRFKQRDRALPRDPIPEHQRVYKAIRASDPDEAAAAMSSLVTLALDDTWFGMGEALVR